MIVNYADSRINKLRVYLFNVIEELRTDSKFQINADMLSNEIDNYSLDKMPVAPRTSTWITGTQINRDVFSFRSRVTYSQDVINNLKNIGFFEEFEKLIFENNRRGVLPEINGIESIECLNCGTLLDAGTNKAIFDIQIQVTYRIDANNQDNISL